MRATRVRVCAVLATTVGLLAVAPAQAAWQNQYAFGATLKGDLYTPTKLGTPPAILVAIHYCTGNSGLAHSWFQGAADTNGFYIIAPDAGKQCFDSSASRDGDKLAIVTMVNKVVTLGGDKNRVFAAGFSSGGCMTNTLLAVYPDVFVGGSALPGYPAGAWPKNDTTCQLCGGSGPGGGDTGQKYADLVKGVFSFSGTRPCSQQWTGGADQYHFADWLPVVLSQFQILGGLGSAASGAGAPSGWTRTVYKDTAGNVRLESNVKPGQAHDLTGSGLAESVVSFLGLDKPTGACGITSTSPGDGGAGATGGATGTGGSTGMGGITGAKDGGVDGNKDSGRDGVVGSGGVSGSGGAVGSGGSASGGTSGNGGVTGNGGSSGNGGAGNGGSGAGGTSSNGGTSGNGGSSAKGGSSGSGGSGNGGTSSAGGTSGSGGSTTGGGTDPGGCGCAVGRAPGSNRGLALFLLVALGLVLRRRRKRLS